MTKRTGEYKTLICSGPLVFSERERLPNLKDEGQVRFFQEFVGVGNKAVDERVNYRNLMKFESGGFVAGTRFLQCCFRLDDRDVGLRQQLLNYKLRNACFVLDCDLFSVNRRLSALETLQLVLSNNCKCSRVERA